MKTQNLTLSCGRPPGRRTGRKIIIGAGVGVTVLVLAVAIILGSVWVEDRYPSDDAGRAIAPQMQRLVTRPIVNALSRQIGNYVRGRAEVPYMNTGLTLEETIARFLDERVDLSERRIYAYRLARDGSPVAVAALLKVLHTAPPEHQAFMAQLIGSTGNPAAKEWLLPLLAAADERTVVGAIHGLSAIGDEDVTVRVAQILNDPERSDTVRGQAALALGSIGTVSAQGALLRAFENAPAQEVTARILDSLGRYEFSAVGDVFENYLARPEIPSPLRVAAVEALVNSSPEAVPFLLHLSGNDANAEVRASAAWAISGHDARDNVAPALTEIAANEPVADVRRRLYEALLPQREIPAARVLPLVQAERDMDARVAGFNAVGHAVHAEPDSAVADTFDREIVPELQRIATTPNTLNIQMRAVFALRRAQTDAARTALAAIAAEAVPQVSTAARNGLTTRVSSQQKGNAP